MYLISMYFDKVATDSMTRLMKKVAAACGNTYMTDNDVPAHMTLTMFEAVSDDVAVKIFDRVKEVVRGGEILIPSFGAFPAGVVYASPVLNEYLHSQIAGACQAIGSDGRIQARYMPYSWQPHVTLGKTLTEAQMQKSLHALVEEFSVIRANVVRVGLARPKPYRELGSLEF